MDGDTKTIAIRAPPNAKPGGKVKMKHQGHEVIVTYPPDVQPGQEIKVQVPKNPAPEPEPEPPVSPSKQLAPLVPNDALRVAARAAEDPTGALSATQKKEDITQKAVKLHMKAVAEKERQEAEEERYSDQAEHIESINTVAAWLLMPAVQRPPKSIKFGGTALKGGWLGDLDMAKYLFYGIFFTFLQVRQTPLVSLFMLKTIILPRQARDKHRESTQKQEAFFACSPSWSRR